MRKDAVEPGTKGSRLGFAEGFRVASTAKAATREADPTGVVKDFVVKRQLRSDWTTAQRRVQWGISRNATSLDVGIVFAYKNCRPPVLLTPLSEGFDESRT